MTHSMGSVVISAAVLNHFWIRCISRCAYEHKSWKKKKKNARQQNALQHLVCHSRPRHASSHCEKREMHMLHRSQCCPPAECYLHLLCSPEYVHLCSVLWFAILFSPFVFLLFFFKETRQLSTGGAAIKNESIFFFNMSIGCHFLLYSFRTWSSSWGQSFITHKGFKE